MIQQKKIKASRLHLKFTMLNRRVSSDFTCLTIFSVILYISFGQCECVKYATSTHLNEFARKINQYLFPPLEKNSTGPETLVWSPLSVFLTLDPLIDAAGGTTYTELDAVLHVSAESKKREVSTNPDYNSVIKDDVTNVKNNVNLSTSSSSPLSSVPPSKRSLKTATGLFISKEYKLNTVFFKKLEAKSYYGSNELVDKIDIKSLDLSSTSPEELAKEVNQWINDTTDGLIGEIIQPNCFNKETKMIIVNGVHFKGKWRSQFRPAETEQQTFYGSQGPTGIKMMFQRSTQDFSNFEEDGFQVLKLAYTDSDMKLVFILPNDTSTIHSIMRSLTPLKIGQIIEQLEPTELDIYIPRFRVESNVPIKHALMKAGLKTLFSRMEANLTRLLDLNVPKNKRNATTTTPENEFIPLYLSDIVHKTVFEMNEEGTKAGAATAGFFIPLSGLMNHRIQNFTLNKPFIFLIRDSQSSIVFQGVVHNIPGEEPVPISDTTDLQPPVPTSKANEILSRSNANENTLAASSRTTESPWWVHKGTPEYLEEMEDEDDNQMISMDKKTADEMVRNNDTSSKKELLFEIVNKNKSPKLRFQQPEPLNPQGIRFPHPGSTNISDAVYQSHSKNKTLYLTYHGTKISSALRLKNRT